MSRFLRCTDDFWCHVPVTMFRYRSTTMNSHWRSGQRVHRAIRSRGSCLVRSGFGHRPIPLGDDLCRTEIDEFDSGICPEQNVLQGQRHRRRKPTFRFDVSVLDSLGMEIHQSLQHLESIEDDHILILYSPVLEDVCDTTTFAVFLEDEHAITMNLEISDYWHELDPPQCRSTRRCSDDSACS